MESTRQRIHQCMLSCFGLDGTHVGGDHLGMQMDICPLIFSAVVMNGVGLDSLSGLSRF